MSDEPAVNTTGTGTAVPHTPSPTAGLPQLLLLLASGCMAALGAVLIAPVLAQMATHFSATPGATTLVPVVLTVPALMIGLTSLFAGVFADRVDRKRLLVGAMVAYSMFGTAPLYLTSLYAVLASRVLVGLCEAAIMTCTTTLIADYWAGARRARYLGLQTLCASLAATVFLALGGVLGSTGWRTPFWLYLCAVLLAAPMVRFLWQPAPADRTTEPVVRAGVPWRPLLVPCAVTLVAGLVFYALIVELSFVLTGLGETSAAAIGGIAAAMSAATALGSVAFARLTRLTPAVLLPVCFVTAAAGLLLVGLTTSVPVVTTGAVLTGFGTGVMVPALLTWAVSRLSFLQRGRGTGLWFGTLFIGQFLSPLVLTGISSRTGTLQSALSVLGVVSAVAGVVTVLALRGRTTRLDTAAP